MALSCRLTIFEGCDGSGKTTAAKAFAAATNARYVHFPALPRVSGGLARMYVEAMLPAVLGYQNVVFDRSWLSETPYGVAFREGEDRLTKACRRMLERLALRCGGLVVWCDPGFEVCEVNYRARKHLEMLDSVDQLRQVHQLYQAEPTDLAEATFDYVKDDLATDIERFRYAVRHPVDLGSAGRWGAQTVLVGEKFAERKNQDPFYQWPFASFTDAGCSRWLTNQLESIEVSEHDLMWVNADQDLDFLYNHAGQIIALGGQAADKLRLNGLEFEAVPHPQHHKRFNGTIRYPLLDLLLG